MLRIISNFFVRLAERWMPDPLVVAIFLTFVALAAAVALTDFGPVDSVSAWGEGFWGLLRFTMQMVLILGLGHLLAHTRPVSRILHWLAGGVSSAEGAYAGLALTGAICGMFSWGVALIVPAVLSRILAANCAERGIRVHFPLLVACGWLGSGTSMQGLSASIPLTVNTSGHFLEAEIGLIPLSATIFSLWSLSILATKVVCIPLLLSRLGPQGDEIREMPPLPTGTASLPYEEPQELNTPSQKIEHARWVTLSLAALGAVYLTDHFLKGGSLNLNTLNMIVLVLGLALVDCPRHYLHLLGNAGRVVAPFFVQYPLYAGIMGIIATSGLGALLVNAFVAVSNADSLPILTFFSAGFLNLFIPSAGGQWAVQGPIAVEAATQLGADIPRVAMALTLGESWTNAIQPIYAIPVLTVAGLHIRDIMGYGVVILGLNGTIYLVALTFF